MYVCVYIYIYIYIYVSITYTCEVAVIAPPINSPPSHASKPPMGYMLCYNIRENGKGGMRKGG